MLRRILSFLLGIMDPKWMLQAQKGETVLDSARLACAVHTWRPRLVLVIKIASVLALLGTIYTLAV